MKTKYALWLILLFSFDSTFSVSSIRSDAIVFISIVFGFYVSTFTYIIFSPLAKKLYAASNKGELTTEFHKVIRIYNKSVLLNVLTIIALLFYCQIYNVMTISLHGFLSVKWITIGCNSVYIGIIVYNVMCFLNILNVNINFSILNIKSSHQTK